MPTLPLASSHMPSHNAAVVIRERIKEKRLFEAQFLFGLLDEDDIPMQERLTLERELDGLLAVVRDLQLQANKYLAEGEPLLAQKMHREMERIAIDVPGLEFGKRHIEEQDIASRAAAPPHVAEKPDQTRGSEDDTKKASDSIGLRQHNCVLPVRQRLVPLKRTYASAPKGKLLLASVLLILLFIGVLFLHLMRSEYSDASLKAKAEEGVTIKPLSVRQGDSSSVHVDEVEQRKTATDADNSAVNIKIGPLSVESGSAQ